MLHRHSLVPARLVKYRQKELSKVPRELRNYYKKEVKLIYLQNRMLINLFNKSRRKRQGRETMNMLYAMRVLQLNELTLQYIRCIGGELNDVRQNISSPALKFRRLVQRKVSAMALTHKYDLSTPRDLPSMNLSRSLAKIQEVHHL